MAEPSRRQPQASSAGEGAPEPADFDMATGRPTWPAAVALLAAVGGAAGFAWAFIVGASGYWLGGFLALGLLGVGFALAYWGRDLVNARPAAGPYPFPKEEDTAGQKALADEVLVDASALTRRRFLTVLLAGGAGLFALSQVVVLGAFGPRPGKTLFRTQWAPGARLVTVDGRPVAETALADGGFLVAWPQGHTEAADSQIVLLRFKSDFTPQQGRETWSPLGFVAYSRVCTHAGCPVAQYEDQAHLLVCPCHQSTFDARQGAKPVFGPAGRALPQLPLAIDAGGFLVAQSDFQEPVGPGFWDLP